MSEFVRVCSVGDLVEGSGVAALLEGQEIALFYIDQQVYALGNYDPIGEASVLSRGMTGDINGELVVASPLYKEHYSLNTGECLENSDAKVPVYETKVVAQNVWVKVN